MGNTESDSELPTACRCGLKSGDRISLKKSLQITNHRNEVTDVIERGVPWEVIGPEYEDGIVWLRDPRGELHTWDDDKSIFEYFYTDPK